MNINLTNIDDLFSNSSYIYIDMDDAYNMIFIIFFLYSISYQLFIIIFGLLSNVITIVIFWRIRLVHLRNTIFYLIAMTLTDIAQLVSEFEKVWLPVFC